MAHWKQDKLAEWRERGRWQEARWNAARQPEEPWAQQQQEPPRGHSQRAWRSEDRDDSYHRRRNRRRQSIFASNSTSSSDGSSGPLQPRTTAARNPNLPEDPAHDDHQGWGDPTDTQVREMEKLQKEARLSRTREAGEWEPYEEAVRNKERQEEEKLRTLNLDALISSDNPLTTTTTRASQEAHEDPTAERPNFLRDVYGFSDLPAQTRIHMVEGTPMVKCLDIV